MSRPGYFTIIAILLGYPAETSMEERGILVRSLFFQKKTLFHLDDHTISNDSIYML